MIRTNTSRKKVSRVEYQVQRHTSCT